MRSHYESVKRVIAVMRNQIDQPLSLHSLARIGFSSPYHFTRTFRRVTGLPPSHFLSALRLDVARRLLLHTRRKVIDICYDVGYNSVGTFTRKFTGSFGVPPTAFRTLAQSQPELDYGRDDLETRAADSPLGHSLSGHVTVPCDFDGLVCVGAFATPIPQSKPLVCAIARRDGGYEMHDVPEGTAFLFALGLEFPIQPHECFHQETALRGGGQAIEVSADGVRGDTDLCLRAPLPVDPPILLFLSNLLEKFASEQQRAEPPWPIGALPTGMAVRTPEPRA
ncbi:MAG TPA: AraC family transcriptional regulator [Candidatus Angelobacter sp.]